jgi:tRNA (guanine10-N2)-dimethyltransferase
VSYLYLLAGENLELAKSELNGFLRSQGIDEAAETDGKLAETDTEPMKGQLKRLALTHEVSKLIERSDELETDYRPKGSYAVRAFDLTGESDTKKIERSLGKELEDEKNQVDLENPDKTIRVYIFEEKYVIGRLVEDIDRSLFEKRKNQNRPFSSPVSLDPVLARVLVNLTGVKPGEKLLDPFCGTGGILIEAGLCGIDVYGTDMQKEMVEGTRENLEEYGVLRHSIRQAKIGDVEEVFDQKFDAVVADVPYGKASKMEGDPIESFLEVAPRVTDGEIVFMSEQESINDLEPEFEIYVHKNLTRYIYILD